MFVLNACLFYDAEPVYCGVMTHVRKNSIVWHILICSVFNIFPVILILFALLFFSHPLPLMQVSICVFLVFRLLYVPVSLSVGLGAIL